MKAPAIHYILKDHLGSWTTVTDATGNIEQELSFDAWGNLRDPETWSGSCSGNPIGFVISMAYFVTDLATDSFNGWGKIQY